MYYRRCPFIYSDIVLKLYVTICFQECGHGWTSMKGRVIFWFELNYATNAGCVMFKLYGQQCQKCKTGKFEHAMWYPEEVVKVNSDISS